MKKPILLSLLLLIAFASQAQKTLTDLQNEAIAIRDATTGQNTAVKVGSSLLDYVNSYVPIIDYAVATGTNAYSATVNSIVTQYVHGQLFRIEFQNANTASSTLNINGLGNILLTSDGNNALTSGMISAGQEFLVYYNGTSFQLNGVGGVPASRQITINGNTQSLASDPSWTISTTTYSADESTVHLTGTQFGIKSSFYSTTPTASTLSQWDANKNLSANNFIPSFNTSATSGGTTILTVSSPTLQYRTGSANETITLPVTSTLSQGLSYIIDNTGNSGVLTVNSSGGNNVITMAAGSKATVTCILTSGTSAASWSVLYLPANPLTAPGDILIGGAVVNGIASPSKLSAGTLNFFLAGQGVGTTPAYIQATSNMVQASSTNDAAIAGFIGEITDGIQSTYTNYTTTATYQQVASITLTAGDWDISAECTFSVNSSTLTTTANAIFVISTTTASASGSTEGRNIVYIPQSAPVGATTKQSIVIAPFRVSISGSTTYFLNSQATFTGGNPQFVGSIHARRNR